MKKIKLLAVLMAVVMTVAVVTVCAQTVTASVTEEKEIGFTYSDVEDNTYEGSTNHCVDWANYNIKQDSNYCKDNEVFTGNLYGEHTLNFTAPEDLEIVNFKFTLYHEERGVTLNSYTPFTAMDCQTAEDDIWMLKGSFAGESPVTVKKGEPLLTADIEIDVGNCSYGELTGVNTTVYFSVDELTVKTANGYEVIIKDMDATEPEEVTTVPADVTTIPAETTFPVIATTSPEAATQPGKPVIFGDANNDGDVDTLDAALVQKFAAERTLLTAEQIYAADVNNDGIADTLDAILIQQFAADIITVFPKK